MSRLRSAAVLIVVPVVGTLLAACGAGHQSEVTAYMDGAIAQNPTEMIPVLCEEARQAADTDAEFLADLITADARTYGSIESYDIRRGETNRAVILIDRVKDGAASSDFFAVSIAVEDGYARVCPHDVLLEPGS